MFDPNDPSAKPTTDLDRLTGVTSGKKPTGLLGSIPNLAVSQPILDNAAKVRRAMVMSTAWLPYEPLVNGEDLMQQYSRIQKDNLDSIDYGDEQFKRARILDKVAEQEASAFSRVIVADNVPDEIKYGADLALALRLREDQTQREQMAVERAHVETMQALTASGDYGQRQMIGTLWNNPTAWHGSVERATRSAYLRKLAEDAGITEENRNPLFAVVDILMLGAIPFAGITSRRGNVNTPTVDGGPGDFFWTGQRLRNEVWALNSIVDNAEFEKEAKNFVGKLVEGSKFFGYDIKLNSSGILEAYMSKTPGVIETNFLDTLDVAFTPWMVSDLVKGAKGLSNAPRALKRAGNRVMAKQMIEGIIADIDAMGLRAAAEKHGMTPDEIEDLMKMGGLNPNDNPHDVSLAGSILTDYEDAKTAADRLLAGALKTARLSDEEASAALPIIAKLATRDFGRRAHDARYSVHVLSNNSTVLTPVITIGKVDGSLYLTREAAEKAAGEIGATAKAVPFRRSEASALMLKSDEASLVKEIDDLKAANTDPAKVTKLEKELADVREQIAYPTAPKYDPKVKTSTERAIEAALQEKALGNLISERNAAELAGDAKRVEEIDKKITNTWDKMEKARNPSSLSTNEQKLSDLIKARNAAEKAGDTKAMKALEAEMDDVWDAIDETSLNSTVREVPSENGSMWAIDVEMPMSEGKYYVAHNQPRSQNFLQRFLLGSRQTAAETTYAMGELVSAKRQRVITNIIKSVGPYFNKLNAGERKMLKDILIKAELRQTWFDEKQFALEWARLSGATDNIRPITDTEIKMGKLAAPGGTAPVLDPQFLADKAFAELKDRAATVGKQVDDLVANSGAADEAKFWETATPEQHALNDERRALAAEIAKGPQVKPAAVIDAFLEAHTYQQWRKAHPDAFPAIYDDLWKALDVAAENAMAVQARSSALGATHMKTATRLMQAQFERQLTPHLEEFTQLFSGGKMPSSFGVGADPTLELFGFATADNIVELGTRANVGRNGIKGLRLPGNRHIMWTSKHTHEEVFDILNDMLEARGEPFLKLEQVDDIRVQVLNRGTPDKKAKFGEVLFTTTEGINTTEKSGKFLNDLNLYSAQGSGLERKIKNAQTNFDKFTTAGGNTETFRTSVDEALTLLDTKFLRNEDGQVLHTNRKSMSTKPLAYTPEMSEKYSPAAYAAFNKLIELSNVEHLLRNEMIYLDKQTRGMNTFQAAFGRGEIDNVDGVVYRGGHQPATPSGRVYNVTDDLHYTGDDPAKLKRGQGVRLTAGDIKQLLTKDGYIMVKLETPIPLRDGTMVQWFVGKPADIAVKPLKFEQLGYRAGGHRGYKDRYLTKQANVGTQRDTGGKFLMNPRTFTIGTKAEMDAWAKTMNTARQIYNNTTDEAERLRLIGDVLNDAKGVPTADEFIMAIKNKEFDPAYAVETVFDREMPSDYAKLRGQGWEDMADVDETGLNTTMATYGKMYSSPKGERLTNWQGAPAEIIDPFEMFNKSLANIASLSSLADYKMREVEKWVATFGKFLDTRGLPAGSSPLRIFQESSFLRDMPDAQRIKNAAESQRDSIKRILNWRSDVDREIEYMGRKLGEYVAGKKPGKWNSITSKGMNYAAENDPVAKARMMAFHMKMGLGAVAQFPMQISTMYMALSIDAVKGMNGMANLMPMHSYLLYNSGDEVLDFWVKAGFHTLSGFDDPEDWKTMMRAAKQSGAMDVGGSHQLINYHGVNAAAGAIGKAGQVLEKGAFFFNEAERWNLTVAWTIAWKRALEKGLKVGTAKFNEEVLKLQGDFSLNMRRAGAASWQKGWASIPTQFLSYQARVLEAMTGKQFTVAEKMRLLLGQFVLYGWGGIPFASYVSEQFRAASGESPKIGTWEGLVDRGMADTLIYLMGGGDVQYGQRAAVGSFVTDMFRELIGMSAYGPTSFADVMGGPLLGIAKASGGAFMETWRYMAAESGGDTGLALTSSAVVELARQVSSFNNAYKAYMVWNYGQYITTTNKVVLDDLPSVDAFGVFLGLAPGEYRDYVAKQDWRKHRGEVVSEAAKIITEFRNRKWREPQNSEAIDSQMELFRATTPEDIWIDARAKADRDPGADAIYKGLARRYEVEREQIEAAKRQEQRDEEGTE